MPSSLIKQMGTRCSGELQRAPILLPQTKLVTFLPKVDRQHVNYFFNCIPNKNALDTDHLGEKNTEKKDINAQTITLLYVSVHLHKPIARKGPS